jgi:hypothetical protein
MAAAPSPLATAGQFAGGLFAKVKDRLNNPKETVMPVSDPATIVDLPPPAQEEDAFAFASALSVPKTKPPPVSGNSAASSDGDWTGTDIAAATEGISNFSIGDDDDDDADLLGF